MIFYLFTKGWAPIKIIRGENCVLDLKSDRMNITKSIRAPGKYISFYKRENEIARKVLRTASLVEKALGQTVSVKENILMGWIFT